ncbi:helix-turn-helix domain-containing protein [Pedobacter zeae]|uniref:AraC family transcriptional regulator n=1 Tax=Pedobacter zeae TaxID=1737356 RepID=A0A7W6P495_9SPHI|nr:AraC family transcriptional regulator [Pedobacter zeae]MBB4106717.1 AraC-like DNA-binding protein [Pedobacter zeae]GGH03326.1 AraC family transcriptional regulator [Pedobacter zeae]
MALINVHRSCALAASLQFLSSNFSFPFIKKAQIIKFGKQNVSDHHVETPANIESDSLFQLYKTLKLPVDLFDLKAGFTVFNLNEIAFELPYQSASYRPNFFSFLFVKNGSGKYTIDEKTFEVEPHSIYFTNPSNYRTFSWNNIEDVLLITFDETFLKKYIGEEVYADFPFLLTETVRPKVVADPFFEEVGAINVQLLNEYRKNTPSKYKIIGHLLAVLLFKIKEHIWIDYNPIYEGNRSSRIVISFKRILEQHYRDLSSGKADLAFRVQDYANALNLHPNYLSSVIKSKTGKNITTWIAEKTLTEAKSLLQNTAIPIKEISYRLGFAETAHFSNFFKKYEETSPGSYKKSHQS